MSAAKPGATAKRVTQVSVFEPGSLKVHAPRVAALRPGDVDVWSVRVDRATPADWARLSLEERARAERLLIDRKRVQQVASRSALRMILAAYLEEAAAEQEFCFGEHGKPALAKGGLSFNLSHSFDWAVIAVAREGRLGIDVEYAAKERAFQAVAEHFFSARERVYLKGVAADERAAAFYRAWTRKEAYLKAWGTGLSFGSTRFCIDFAPQSAGRVLSTQMPGDDPEQWHFLDLPVATDYPAALCWDQRPMRVRAFCLQEPSSPP